MTDKKDGKKMNLDTLAIHAGQHPDPEFGAVSPPIFQTSTFAFKTAEEGKERFAGEAPGYIYTRMGNPTTSMLEENIATLEGGVGARATASGMAAICTVYFALLNQGDHIIATESLYGPSRVVVERDFSRFGVEASFVDTSDPEEIRKAVRPNSKVLFIETPANPTIKLTDIAVCSKIARERGMTLVIDNTFMSPILQRPFEMGADIVIHSMTKFINGHTDVVGGMIVFNDEETMKNVSAVLYFLGGTIDPHQAWLVLRGVKSLPLRIKAAQKSAMIVAEFLENHDAIEWVRYPGLKSHPQYRLAQSQMDGPGALISFEMKGGVVAGRKLMNNVKLATLAVSLGGIETLIQHPAGMTHATMTSEAREEAGISDGLVRISIGCEAVEDLLDDLKQALAAAQA